MPAKKHKEKTINLLPQEEFSASTLGRILTWLLSSFRIIVIVSEMVVMGAFISRFWLDARNADLSDEIEQRQAIVNSYKDFEADFRAVQKKLIIFSSLATPQNTPTELIDHAFAIVPTDIVLTGIESDQKTLLIKGIAPEESSINTYMESLKFTQKFDEVNISQLTIDKSTAQVAFLVEAKIAQGER